MNAIRLAPLDSPIHKANQNNNNHNATGGGGTAGGGAAAGGGGVMSTRKSFSETQSTGGQGPPAGGQGQPGETEEVDGKKKDDVRMRVGYYQMDKMHHVRYVFIPKAMLRNPQVRDPLSRPLPTPIYPPITPLRTPIYPPSPSLHPYTLTHNYPRQSTSTPSHIY